MLNRDVVSVKVAMDSSGALGPFEIVSNPDASPPSPYHCIWHQFLDKPPSTEGGASEENSVVSCTPGIGRMSPAC